MVNAGRQEMEARMVPPVLEEERDYCMVGLETVGVVEVAAVAQGAVVAALEEGATAATQGR